ncbi:MAG: PAS domain S-box protein, partial [Desulfatirhabdiaceae bacterium]
MLKKPTYEELEQKIAGLEQIIADYAQKDQASAISSKPLRSSSEMDLRKILDLPAIQSLMDVFHKLTHFGVAILDLDGNILVATGWQDICTKFHRIHPETCKNCLESDLKLTHDIEPGKFRLYRCKNNMWDISTPIMVGKTHMGNLFLGQFLFEDELPDIDFFQKQGRRYGFDKAQYLAALERVPRWHRETVNTVMTFYTKLSHLIAELSLSNIRYAQTLMERDNLLKSLQDSEKRFSFIAETITEVFWLADLSIGATLYVSPGYETLWGRSVASLYQNPQSFIDAIHVEDRERVLADFKVKKDRQPFDHEYRIVRPDGDIRWIRDRGYPVRDRAGQVDQYAGIARDITESKQAETRLKAAYDKLEMLWGVASMVHADVKTISDHVLASITRMSDSRYGFYGFINEDESIMTIHAWSGDAMKDCAMVDKPRQFSICKSGIWAEAIRHREPLIINDYAAVHAGKKGLPEGHVALTNLLVAPFFEDGRITAVAAVANRPTDYGQKDVNQITAFLGSVQAVVDHRRTEEELRKTEQQLKLIFDTVPALIWQKDREGRYLQVNQAYCQTIELSENDIIGKTDHDFFPKEIADKYVRDDLIVMNSGIPKFGMEEHHQKASGERGWSYTNKMVCFDDTGYAIGTIGFGMDITRRKNAEAKLHESEIRLRTVLETIPDLIWLKDPNGVYLDCNLMFERFFGANKTDIIGKTDYDFVDRALADFFREHDRKAMIAGKPSSNEEWLTFAADGYRGVFDTIKTPMCNADGQLIGVLGIARDITQRKLAEESLKKSQEKLKNAQHYARMGSWTWNIQTNQLDWSDEMFRIFGLDRETFTGSMEEVITRAVHPEDRARFEQSRLSAIEHKKPVPLEYRVIWPDQSVHVVWAEAGEFVLDEAGNPELLSGTVQDITERKQGEAERLRLEARLQQAQKMESIGSLAGGIAHDLNNILFPISGLSEMLLEDVPMDSPWYENIEQIHKSARRGGDLVKQILAFARQSNPQKLPVRIQPILKEVLKLSRSAIPMNIEIKSLVDTNCRMVSADPSQLHQVVMNLITNAFHAVEDKNGTIYVALSEKMLNKDDFQDHTMKPGRYACITISDTGTGVDPTLIHKIFDPYFTTKEQGKGTGLGLSVVHGIVKAHGGDIQVYSEVGKGTFFHVYLPVLEDTNDQKTPGAARTYPVGCERILLADDEEPILRVEQQILERLGYQITARTGSLDALAVFRSNPEHFDLVITDRSMPNMTGDQLAKELISIKPGIPIIICTGFSNEKDT